MKQRLPQIILAAMTLMCFCQIKINCTEVITKDEPEEEIFASSEIVEDNEIPVYFDDAGFDNFFNTCVERYNHGEKPAITDVHMLILARRCSQEQVLKVVNSGYLTEYIDEYKESGVLPEDYQLPDGIEIHPTDIGEPVIMEGDLEDYYSEYEDPQKTYTHNVSETASHESQMIMVDLMQDDVLNNAIIFCPNDSADKRLAGQMIEISAFRGEPLSITFVEDINARDLKAVYTWRFPGIYYLNRDYLNLDIKFDEYSLDFNLGDTLPSAAVLILYTDKPAGTIVNFKDKDGNIVMAPEVDEEGRIMIDAYDSGHYTIAYEEIKVGEDGEQINGIQEKTDKAKLHEIPQISNIWILIAVLILFAMGSVFATLAILNTSHKSSPHSYKKSSRRKRR